MHILALLRQNWDPRLSDNKVPFEEVSYLRKLRSVEDTTWTTDSVELFMKSYDDDAPDPDADAVILVSKGTSADELRIADLRPGRAWLDDSSDEVCAEEPYEVHSNPQSSQHAPINSLHSRIYRYRQYKGYHTAFELWQHLCTKRYGHKDLPDAHRRLIFIPDLDRYFIWVIVETATSHMASTIRDALLSHISMHMSLKTKIIRTDIPIFRLEFHIPYHASRRVKPGDKAFSRGHRKSLDVSFLTNNNTIAVIYEAHISVIVVGTGEKRWTAYSFADTYFDPDGEPGEDEFSYQFSMADPIIAGRCPIDANKPDWNPRAYFMMAVRNRMEQVTREWRVLVGQLKIGIKDFRALNPSLIGSIGAPRNSDEDILDPLKWTTRICQLVNDLMEVLAKTKGELNAFMADDGDIQYFVKSEGPYPEVDDTICNSLRDIKGFLDELRSCKRELKYVLRSREEHIRVAQLHQLHLTRESSHAVQRNVSATDITVLAISPIAVVSTVFAIPTNVLWFTRNFQSFSLSVLAMAVSIQILSYLLATWREHIVVRRWWNRLAGCQMKGGRDTAETHAVERFNTTDHRPQSGGSHRTDTIDTMETLVGGTIPSLQVETV